MTVTEAQKVNPETLSLPPLVELVEGPKEKVVVPPPTEENLDDSKALVVAEKPIELKNIGGSVDRDAVLAQVVTEKRWSFLKAWEECEKSNAESKAQKKLAAIGVWENCKKASLEAELKQIEGQLEKRKAKYVEKVKNKVALIHKAAEEKQATTEAKRGEDLLKAEETVALYHATGTGPKKLLRAEKKLAAIWVWENCKKASLEAELKRIEGQLEKKKAKYVEKVKNKIALIHKAAEEKRATTEAKRGEDLLKAEKTVALYHATGTGPKKLLRWF